MNALPNWHRIPLRAILLVTLAILAATTAIDRPAAAQNEDRLVRNLRVAPSDKQLDVSWDLPTNTTDLQIFIVRWRVKATTSTSDQNTANATDTSYSITELDGDDLENGTEYEVAVQSIYTGGVGQPQTPWVTAIPNIGPLTTPAAPTSVQVAPGINSLDVTWTASQVTGNNAPTSYIVDWNPGPQQDADTTTSYTIPNLTAGTTYSVRVRAENGAGGAWSSSVNGVPVSGPQVTTIDIESNNNSIATIRIYLANPDATQQTVYYCIIPTDRTCSGTEIQNTNTYSPHTSAFLIPMNLAENTTFIVSASLDADMATNVKTARFTTLGPPDKLRLNVSPTDGELYVTWSVDLNGGAPRGQILMWKLATATSFTDDNVGPANDARRYTITELNGTPLVNGTDYTVQISVLNEYGTATSDEVTRAPAPGPNRLRHRLLEHRTNLGNRHCNRHKPQPRQRNRDRPPPPPRPRVNRRRLERTRYPFRLPVIIYTNRQLQPLRLDRQHELRRPSPRYRRFGIRRLGPERTANSDDRSFTAARTRSYSATRRRRTGRVMDRTRQRRRFSRHRIRRPMEIRHPIILNVATRNH